MRCSSDCAAASVVTRTRIDDKSSPIRMSQRTGGQPSSHRWYVMRKQDSGSSHEGEMKMIRSAFTRRVLVAALATELGAFERRGLDVEFTEVQGATPAAAMVGDGKKFWIGSSSGTATAIGRSRGLPIKSLAVYYHKTPSTIFTRAE